MIHRRQIRVEFNRCDLAGIAFSPRRFEMTNSVVENFCHEAMDDRFARLLAEGVDKPTAYRARLRAIEAEADLSSRRAAVSAGETLPAPVYEAWIARTGKPPLLAGIGATEMRHSFIANRPHDHAPDTAGRPVTGYAARIVDDEMRPLPRRARSAASPCA